MITVRKLTDIELMKECLEFAYGIEESKMTEALAYHREHSIIRTQLFLIKMMDIPTKVSVHFVRHAATGQFHLVGSNRADWNYDKDWDGDKDIHTIDHDHEINRATPVNHVMILNAGHLIDMSKKRLCSKAEKDTREAMEEIREKVWECDPDLTRMMVPTCYYRGGVCPEPNSCGRNIKVMKDIVSQVPEHVYRKARNDKVIAEEGRLIDAE